MPKVSVIVPNYNHAAYLKQRIDSILEQTFQDFELLLMDDCSIDGSRGIIEGYRGDRRIQIVLNEVNSGSPFKQWHKGLSLAKGEYLWIAESDDYAGARFLEVLVEALERRPQAGLAYCQSWLVNGGGRIVNSSLAYTEKLDAERWKKDYLASGAEECGRYLIWQNTIPNASAVLVRRQALGRVIPLDESFQVCGDWMTWVQIIMASGIVYKAEALNYYRDHAGTVRSQTRKARAVEEALQVQAFICRRAVIPKETLVQIRARAARCAKNALGNVYPGLSVSLKLQILKHALRINPWLFPTLLAQSIRKVIHGGSEPDGHDSANLLSTSSRSSCAGEGICDRISAMRSVLQHVSATWLWGEWARNHRHHGGLAALLRCLAGSYRLARRSGAPVAGGTAASVESITFSVVPQLTFLWAFLLGHALGRRPARILIGDCSGGLAACKLPNVDVFPLLNLPHGEKLDLCLKRRCLAPYVIVSDDDVFWLSEEPLRWALAQFESDERLAAVSLVPRNGVSSVLKGKVEQPMGSYCLIIRRHIWLKEDLSFRIVKPPPEDGYDWFYDTADFANVELLKRGYRVAIAPPEIRQHLCCLEAISTWTLKIQHRRGDLNRSVADITLRRAKALRAVLTLRGLGLLVKRYFPGQLENELVPAAYLERAESFCRASMTGDEVSVAQQQVLDVLGRVQARVQLLLARDAVCEPAGSRAVNY